MIKGVTVTLIQKVASGTDEFNRTTFEEKEIAVDNVLVGEPTTDDVNDTISLYGKKLAYTLGIPKGDTNDWTDTDVILPEPFGGRYHTIGIPTAGIEANIPGKWNKKVKLERYE